MKRKSKMAKKMTEQEVTEFGIGLMFDNLDNDWEFNINTRLRVPLGRCNYYYSDEVDQMDLPMNVIHIAGRVVKQGNRELIEQVLRHEVAHAMMPWHNKHDRRFYDQVVELGGLDKPEQDELLRANGYNM
jgi:hypothetical protein